MPPWRTLFTTWLSSDSAISFFQFRSFSPGITLRTRADVMRLNKGHFTLVIMFYAKHGKRQQRKREREDDCKDVFSRILTPAAQKRQSDLALWISEEHFRSLISFFEPRVKLLGYRSLCVCVCASIHTHTHIIAWLNSSPSHNGRQHVLINLSDICSVTPVTWRRLPSVSWPEQTLRLLCSVQSTVALCSYK